MNYCAVVHSFFNSIIFNLILILCKWDQSHGGEKVVEESITK